MNSKSFFSYIYILLVKDALEIKRSLVPSAYHILSGYSGERGDIFGAEFVNKHISSIFARNALKKKFQRSPSRFVKLVYDDTLVLLFDAHRTLLLLLCDGVGVPK